MLLRPLLLCSGLAAIAALSAESLGQTSRAKPLEMVVTASGDIVAPWSEREICRRTTRQCQMAIMNPETGEIAKMGNVLGTDFERTGNGQEIRRAESAMSKALKAQLQN